MLPSFCKKDHILFGVSFAGTRRYRSLHYSCDKQLYYGRRVFFPGVQNLYQSCSILDITCSLQCLHHTMHILTVWNFWIVCLLKQCANVHFFVNYSKTFRCLKLGLKVRILKKVMNWYDSSCMQFDVENGVWCMQRGESASFCLGRGVGFCRISFLTSATVLERLSSMFRCSRRFLVVPA